MRVGARMPKDITNRSDENQDDNRAHPDCQASIDARRSLNSLNVYDSERNGKENLPPPDGNRGRKLVRLYRTPDYANQWIYDVIHDKAPARDKTEAGMDFLRHIGECRPCAWIGAGHFAVAHRCEQHGHHSDQNRGHHMAPATVAQGTKYGHRGHRLKHNRAVQNQIPQRERPFQPWRCTYAALFVHAALLEATSCDATWIKLFESFQVRQFCALLPFAATTKVRGLLGAIPALIPALFDLFLRTGAKIHSTYRLSHPLLDFRATFAFSL